MRRCQGGVLPSDFPLRRRNGWRDAMQRIELSTQLPQPWWQRSFRGHRIELIAQVLDVVLEQLAGLGALAHLVEIVVVLLRAVGELVSDAARVLPQPCNRPDQSTERKPYQPSGVDH